jgi:hypothetical protein
MLTFIAPWDQLWIIRNMKDRLPKALNGSVNVVSYHDLRRIRSFEAGALVFTGLGVITDHQRQAASEIHAQLLGKSESLMLLNHPEKSLRRLDLIKKLHELGINDFLAYKTGEYQNASVRFPVFVREARRHSGSLTGLIDNASALEKSIQSLEKSGYPANDLLIVEFCNTSDENGLYRKYSALKIGDAIIPRYLSLGYNWVVKENEPNPDTGELYDDQKIKEELDYIHNNPHKKELEKIFKLAHIDYGRIDYGLKDGRLQVWEINTLPTFGQPPGFEKKSQNTPRKKARAKAKELFYEEFSDTVRDLSSSGQSYHIPIELPGNISRPLAHEERKQRFVDATVKLGEKIPRIPFLNELRTVIKRKLRSKNESAPKI